jgi:hypothetical protein
MTFEPEDISVAMDSLRLAQDIADRLRKGDPSEIGNPQKAKSESGKPPSPTRTSAWSFTGFLSGAAGLVTGKGKEGAHIRDLSVVQRHAELVGCEAQGK